MTAGDPLEGLAAAAVPPEAPVDNGRKGDRLHGLARKQAFLNGF